MLTDYRAITEETSYRTSKLSKDYRAGDKRFKDSDIRPRGRRPHPVFVMLRKSLGN